MKPVDCECSRSSELLGMEEFVDIEKMFSNELAMDMDLPLPLLKHQNLGNIDYEEKKVEVVGGNGILEECVLQIAPNVSKDAWDLLDVIEGDSSFNTRGIVCTNEALSQLMYDENQICYVIPSIVSDNELAGESGDLHIKSIVSHKDQTMEVPVYNTGVAETESMEVPASPSFPDPAHLFEATQDIKPTIGVDTPMFLSNMDLPTDVATPDVDLSFLTNQTLELLPTPALNEALKSVEYGGLNLLDKKIKDDPVTDNVETIPQIVPEPTTPPTVAGILRLNTGSEVTGATGKGAALQLRRKGGKRPLDVPKIEVLQENGELTTDGSTTTIIITLSGSSTSPTTNISCVTNEDAEVPVKKAKLGEKYIDMRRKNNEASRRSRQTRKERELEMGKLADKLTNENAELRQKVAALEKLRDSVKAELMKVLSGK